jgi:hypothetical protein
MTTRPIDALASGADDPDADVLGISSISYVMQIVPQLTIAGEGDGISIYPREVSSSSGLTRSPTKL